MIPAIVLTLQLAATTAVQPSTTDAAAFAIDRLTESFGPYSSRGDAHVPAGPWLTTPQAMERESEIVRLVARQWWGERVRFDPSSIDLGEGLVWYLQSRIIEDLFDRRWRLRAYALDVRRYFGGLIPWQLRTIPVSRNAVGIARDVYLGRPQRRWRRDVTPAVARAALGFASLEQRHTWPVLERALRVIAEEYSGKSINREAFGNTLSRAVGMDVNAFVAVMAGQDEIEARIDRVVSEACAPAPCVRSGIELRGRGQDAWLVRMRFDDGQQLETTWRPASGNAVWIESAVAPLIVEVDPQRTNLIDRDYRDNIVVLRPSTDVPVRKWTVQWLMWLQHVILTYTAPL